VDFLSTDFAPGGDTHMVSPKVEFAQTTTNAEPNPNSEFVSAVKPFEAAYGAD